MPKLLYTLLNVCYLFLWYNFFFFWFDLFFYFLFFFLSFLLCILATTVIRARVAVHHLRMFWSHHLMLKFIKFTKK